VYWGSDAVLKGSGYHGIGIDAGFATAINGNLSSSGWIISGNTGYSHTKDAGSKTNSFYTSALFGHLWQMPDYYLSLSGGVNFNNNDETPSGGKTDGSKVGAVLAYGFETKSVDALYVQSYGSVSTVYNQLYLHGKLGYKTASFNYGGEYTFSDDKGSKATHRFGGFIGDISIGEKVTMGVSAGYQHSREPGDKDGAYATIAFSMPISFH